MNRSGKNRTIQRLALITGGTVLGLFFFYLAFRDISLSELAYGMRQFHPIYFIHTTVVLLLIQLLRAYRFGVIVAPFCQLSLKQLWDVTNIWAALNMLMPARLAEFVRPYLLTRSGASFSSSLGAVMVERFFDLSGLLTLLALVLWRTPEIPKLYTFLGQAMLVVLITSYVAVLVLLARRDAVQRVVERLLRWLPDKAASWVGGTVRRLIDGLGIMASVKQALLLFACSIVLWTLFALLTYIFLKAFSIEVPFLVAITIQVFLCLGVALPSAPGFIGTFHAAGRYSLALFGVAAVPAVSFATVYHCFSLVGCVLLGLLSYFTGDYGLDRDLFEQPDSAEDGALPRKMPATIKADTNVH